MRRAVLGGCLVLLLASWGLCCAARARLSSDSWPNHESPHLDLRADRTRLVRPGEVRFAALLRGQPIAEEWGCAQEIWAYGDGGTALRAEGESSTPCGGIERYFEHPHYYGVGTHEAQLTLYSRKKHSMGSNVVTIIVQGIQ